MEVAISTPNIDDRLLEMYRESCENIPDETIRLEKQMRDEITNSEIRKQRGNKWSRRSTIRLTSEQKDIAKQKFKAFFERMIDYDYFFKTNIGKHPTISPYYDVFTYARLALESYTRSMYTCFRCGEIVSVNVLKTKDRIAYHQCDDGEAGYGSRTSWLYIYATYVDNKYMIEAMGHLNTILNAYVKN